MIICPGCDLPKDEQQDFYDRGDGTKRKNCKKCENKKKHKNYLANREERKKHAREWYHSNIEKVKDTHKAYLKTPKGRLVKLLKGAKVRAEKYEHDFDIDTDYLLSLWETQSGKCALTNFPFEFENSTQFSANPYAPSVDRIDSTKGYIKGNVRLVCVAINYALNEFGEEILKQMCLAYIQTCELSNMNV